MPLRIIFYLVFCLLYSFTFTSNIFSQDSPPSTVIGPMFIKPGDGFSSPTKETMQDSQLYMPETFTPTRIYPISKKREQLTDQILDTPRPISQKYTAGLTIGAQYGQYETLPYADIFFSPYLKLREFFFMYECPLRFDWHSTFVTKLWKGEAALVSKIECDFFYDKEYKIFRSFKFNICRSENLIQGHGRFFYDYNPNLYGPYETFKSLNIGLDILFFGLKYTIANIARAEIMSTELYIKPCAALKNPKLEFLQDFKLYCVCGVDLNPFRGYSPGLYQFSPKTSSISFSLIEAGFDIPLIKTKKNLFSLDIYTDFAYIIPQTIQEFTIQQGTGISGGLIMTFVDKLPIQLEIAKAFGVWQPRWVNIFYNIDSVYVNEPNDVIPNKLMKIQPNLMYFMTSIGFNWIKKGIFSNFELFGDMNNNDFWITLSCTLTQDLLKIVSLSVYWTLRSLQQKLYAGYTPMTTVLEIKITYHMLPNMNWGILWKMNGQIGQTFDIESTQSIIDIKRFVFVGIDFSFRY